MDARLSGESVGRFAQRVERRGQAAQWNRRRLSALEIGRQHLGRPRLSLDAIAAEHGKHRRARQREPSRCDGLGSLLRLLADFILDIA